jgi:hypothetical protein
VHAVHGSNLSFVVRTYNGEINVTRSFEIMVLVEAGESGFNECRGKSDGSPMNRSNILLIMNS